jgi:hypothetical protein
MQQQRTVEVQMQEMARSLPMAQAHWRGAQAQAGCRQRRRRRRGCGHKRRCGREHGRGCGCGSRRWRGGLRHGRRDRHREANSIYVHLCWGIGKFESQGHHLFHQSPPQAPRSRASLALISTVELPPEEVRRPVSISPASAYMLKVV